MTPLSQLTNSPSLNQTQPSNPDLNTYNSISQAGQPQDIQDSPNPQDEAKDRGEAENPQERLIKRFGSFMDQLEAFAELYPSAGDEFKTATEALAKWVTKAAMNLNSGTSPSASSPY